MLANARLAEHYLRHQMEALPLSLPNSKLSLRTVVTNQVLPYRMLFMPYSALVPNSLKNTDNTCPRNVLSFPHIGNFLCNLAFSYVKR